MTDYKKNKRKTDCRRATRVIFRTQGDLKKEDHGRQSDVKGKCQHRGERKEEMKGS